MHKKKKKKKKKKKNCIVAIKPVRGCVALQGDITKPETKAAILREARAAHAVVDVVLHDGAPNVGANWVLDAFNQNELVLCALKTAVEILEPNGYFVTKVFRSLDYNSLLWVFNQLFDNVHATKPVASRNVSAEIFVVCKGFKAPKKLDPRFLDPKFVFEGVKAHGEGEAPRLGEFFRSLSKKAKRKREGYEDGNQGLLFKTVPAAEFVGCEEPAKYLIEYNALTFEDDDSKEILASRHTTEEIKAIAADFKVLSKGDFKLLLKWRKRVGQELKAKLLGSGGTADDAGVDAGSGGEDGGDGGGDDDDDGLDSDEKLEMAMAEVRKRKEAREKRKKRKERKARAALQRKIDMKMVLPDDVFDHDQDDEVFDLHSIKTKDHLNLVTEDNALVLKAANLVARTEEDAASASTESEVSETDSDESSRTRRLRETERNMDKLHKVYMKNLEAKRGRSRFDDKDAQASKRVRVGLHIEEMAHVDLPRRKQALIPEGISADVDPNLPRAVRLDRGSGEDGGEGGGVGDDDDDDDDMRGVVGLSGLVGRGGDDDDGGFDSEESEEDPNRDRNPLVAKGSRLLEPMTTSHKAQVWYSQSMFRDLEKEEAELASETAAERAQRIARENKRRKNDEKLKGLKKRRKLEGGAVDADDEDGEDDGALAGPRQGRGGGGGGGGGGASTHDIHSDIVARMRREREAEDEKGFEVVAKSDSEEEDDADASYDDIGDAQIMALGYHMLEKRVKSDLMDNSYNRYAFNDQDLPDWFAVDEEQHNKPLLPITKAAVEKMKQRMRLVNSRPIAKIAEAKARKRHRFTAKVDKIKKQVVSVIDKEDATEKEKARQIEKLYKRMAAKSVKKTTFAVATKSGGIKGKQGKKGANTRIVDSREKKDLRAKKAKGKRDLKKAPRSAKKSVRKPKEKK